MIIMTDARKLKLKIFASLPVAFMLSLLSLISGFSYSEKIVVAHRGASGYLPEHSIPAKAMAYAMGADYLEQDVVMTKDDQLIVLHDRFLDRVTDVSERFPGRARDDGRYYVIDFTLQEIRQLKVSEGFHFEDGKRKANFPSRFPLWKSSFRIHTLAEEIELIQGLNRSTGKEVGIYPEIKAPWFHRQQGKDISRAVLNLLKRYGYSEKNHKVFLQTFDFNELRRLHDELFPTMEIELKLVQLIAETAWEETMEITPQGLQNYDYDWMLKPGAMAEIAKYADGVGPTKAMIISDDSTKDNIIVSGLVKEAHAVGLQVHPFTFRLDPGRLPPYAESFEQLLDLFYNKANVDGVFTDFPDRAVRFLSSTRGKN